MHAHYETPDTTNPDHHLWNNNGTYYLAVTLVTDDRRTARLRSSLKTKDLQDARVRRDAVLDVLVLQSGCDRRSN